MNVLDIFSGLKGWSQAFEDRGHKVTTVDIEPKFKPTICVDVMNLKPSDLESYGHFDVILASPPCNCFSIASVYRHWKNKRPIDDKTVQAIKLVGHTIYLILSLNPRFWILENPMGMMRNVLGKPSVTTYFASWQNWSEYDWTKKAFHDKRKPCLKPTDLWGVLPNVQWKKPKEWIKSPRGSHDATQGKPSIDGVGRIRAYTKDLSHLVRDSMLRAKIPYGLSLAVCLACEQECQ